jgi:hypothetical protein
MHSALWLLLGLRTRAAIRLKLRELRTARGRVYLLLGLAVVSLVFGSRIVNEVLLTNLQQATSLIEMRSSEDMLTAMLAAVCLLTLVVSSGPAIYFSPSEANLLFSGPFSRRDLLFYKFLSYLAGVVVTALVFAFFARHQTSFAGAFLGTVAAMLFVQLFATTVSLLDIEVRYFRTLVIILFVSFGVIVIWQSLSNADGIRTGIAAALMMPFRIFVRTFLAERLWPDLMIWGFAAVATNLVLLGFLVWKNIDYREAVTATSQKLHQRWLRARRSGVWGDYRTSKWRLPYFLGHSAFGVMVLRQMTTAVRTFRGAMIKMLLVALCIGPLLSFVPAQSMPITFGLCISLSLFLLPKVITFDFRSDWDYMMILRSLPLRPSRIALAQLVTPVILLSMLEAVGLVSMLPFVSYRTGIILSWTIAILLPFNALVSATDNLLFLLFPATLTPVGRLDFEFFGRSLIEFFVRMLVISMACGASLALGSVVASQVGDILLGLGIAFWAVFSTATGLMVPALAWAFERFDDTVKNG